MAGPASEEHASFYDERWAGDEAKGRLNTFQLARISAVYGALSYIDREFAIRERPMTACDLGCGRGWLTTQLLNVADAVTGVDLSPGGVEIAKKRWPEASFVCADILEFDSDTKFDLIVSSEVIEHVPDQRKFVQSVARNLTSRGFVVITCPNASAKRTMEISGNVTQPIEDWPTMRGLRELFRADFEILDHKTFVHDYSYLGFQRLFSAPKLIRFLRRTRLLPAYWGVQSLLGVGYHQVMVARKRA